MAGAICGVATATHWAFTKIPRMSTEAALVDLSIARQYAGLVADEAVRDKIFKTIEDEYALTRDMVLRVTGSEQIADRFKQQSPVILNLQGVDAELSKRLIDFASGLTYALNGGMQRVADKVFLLTPRNVEVSAEQRAQILAKGDFFNQA